MLVTGARSAARFPGYGAAGADLAVDGIIALPVDGAGFPTACLDACFEDGGCGGFVISHGLCHFRAEGAAALVARKQRDGDSTLFVLEAHRPSEQPPIEQPPTEEASDSVGIIISVAIAATLGVLLAVLAVRCATTWLRRNAKATTAPHIEAFETGISSVAADRREAQGLLWRSLQLLLPFGCAAPRKREPAARINAAPEREML